MCPRPARYRPGRGQSAVDYAVALPRRWLWPVKTVDSGSRIREPNVRGLEGPPKPPNARKRPGAAGALLEFARRPRAKAGRVVRPIGLAIVLTLSALAPVGANAQPTKTPRIGFLGAGNAVPVPSQLEAFRQGLRELGFSVRSFKVGGPVEYESPFRAAQSERIGAIQVLPSPYFNIHRRQLIERAAKYRLPAIYEFKDYVQDGGLMSYGPDINPMFRRAASYVDRILKGAKPRDLPVERPSTFELTINLKTAKALGLTIPQSGLGRADHVLE